MSNRNHTFSTEEIIKRPFFRLGGKKKKRDILQIEITVGKEEEEEEEKEGEKKKKKSVRHLRCWNRVGLGAKRGKRHHRRRYRAHNRHGGR